jgi:hypothetical protein
MLARRPLYQRPNDPTCQLDYFSFYEAAAGTVHVLKVKPPPYFFFFILLVA